MTALTGVFAHSLPEDALLQRYATDTANYTDCYVKDVAGHVGLSDFIAAFYVTPLFKAERFVLKYAARRPSTEQDVIALVRGNADTFSAWTVEDRTDNQILLCDMGGHTRSWFMVTSVPNGTRLFFGSAVVPGTGFAMRVLTPMHKLYARALLRSTRPH